MTPDSRGLPLRLALGLARRGRDQRWAVGIVVLAASAVALAVAVGNGDLLPGERTVGRWFHDHAGGPGRGVSDALDVAMSKQWAPVLFVALLPMVWWAWGRFAAFGLILAGLAAVVTLIDLASRPRPSADFTVGDAIRGEAGYPSGHVVFAVIVLGMVAFLANRYTARSMPRSALVWTLVVVLALMGPSRLVELDHWPADVIGGYLIGLALLLGTIWVYDHILSWTGRRYPRLRSLLAGDSNSGPEEGPPA